jgi:lysyl-tRNA synthetase class 1
MYWADQIARHVVKKFPGEKTYTCAAGITPSGTIHIGNFREIITVDIIVRALKDMGKRVRYIYSWDDYDRLRKIPNNVPNPEALKQHLLKPGVEVPDPWGCHSSYVRHFEKEVEDSISKVGIKPKFIYQSKMYRASKYAKDIRETIQKRGEVRRILNKYRKDPLPKDWWPLGIYCQKCGYEKGRVVEYDGDYRIKYACSCGYKKMIDIRRAGNIKLPWRIDWPMRWRYEGVKCEGGGKEHNAPGGSLDTGHDIAWNIFDKKPPVRFMYDYIIVRGAGGKMSSSLGNVITLNEVLEVFIPEVVRFIFAGTKPIKEFAFAFDEEVFKVYEDFYRVERIYYGKEEVSDRDAKHWSRVYEMSCIKRPRKQMPLQPSFKHAVTLISAHKSVGKAIMYERKREKMNKSDIQRYEEVLTCAKNWLEKHSTGKYKSMPLEDGIKDAKLSSGQQAAAKELAAELLKKDRSEGDLMELFRDISKRNNIEMKEFFHGVYMILFGKESGPRLATVILSESREKISKLLS